MKTKSFLIFLLFLLLLGLLSPAVFSQQRGKPITQEAVATKNAESNPLHISVREMFNEASFLGYIIAFVLAIGLFLIFTQFLISGVDRRRSKLIYNTKLQNLNLQEISHLVEHSKGTAAGLVRSLLEVFQATGSFESLNQEITLFNRAMQDRFKTFKNWLSFLSNSAGALGLLGTVLGMYITFKGGILEHSKILNGMALALVTTLMGIVVSLILDLGSTVVNSFFSKNLGYSLQKSDEFRLALLHNSDPSEERGTTQKTEV